MIESISAITLATHNTPHAVRFYRPLGVEIVYGGEDAAVTSFRAGTSYLNLITQPVERNWSWAGGLLNFRWTESGGPTIAPPTHRGCGTRIIENIIGGQLGGRARFDWRARGLNCEIALLLP
jgi:hypothetical protein